MRLVLDTNTIVSGDADLLEVRQYQGIPIVTAAAALRLIARP